MEIKCDTAQLYTLRLTSQEKAVMEEALYDYLQYIRTQREIMETFMPTDPADEVKRIEGIAFYAEKIKIIEEMQKSVTMFH